MGQGGVRRAFAAQHASDLGHALFFLDGPDSAGGSCRTFVFGHLEMVVCTGRDLWEMGHGQDLTVAAQLPHQPTHGFRHGAAHAGGEELAAQIQVEGKTDYEECLACQ